MKTLQLFIMGIIVIFFGIIFYNAYALSNSDMPSSTPENVGTGPYSYTDNTPQLQFIIPVVIAIISVVAGIAIYSGTKTIKK